VETAAATALTRGISGQAARKVTAGPVASTMVAEVGAASASTVVSYGTTASPTGIANVVSAPISMPQAFGGGALAAWDVSALWDW
jgi:hypothetical protein